MLVFTARARVKVRHATTLMITGVFIAVFILPILAGLLGTLLPAFNYLPALGEDAFSLKPVLGLWQHPSTLAATYLSLQVGWLSTFLSVVIALLLFAHFYQQPRWPWLTLSLSPILAVPHAALAVGLSFLIAPSGWLVRLVSPELTGFDYPPNWQTTQDPQGLSLVLLMVLKEVPFLLLMLISAAKQVPIQASLTLAQSMGYTRATAWLKLIFPQLLGQLRLPISAVLAWSLSAVDVSLILGPSTPPTLSVLVLSWFNDADITLRLQGAAGALWLLFINLGSIGLMLGLARFAYRGGLHWFCNGKRSTALARLNHFASAITWLFILAISLSFIVLVLWSMSAQWRFPDSLPSLWQLSHWQSSWDTFLPLIKHSIMLGAASCVIAIVLSLIILEIEAQHGTRLTFWQPLRWLPLFYVPLLIPDTSYLFGIQVSLIYLQWDGWFVALLWGHLMYVLPYTFLSIAPYYRRYNQAYWQQALLLCKSPWRSYFWVKLPMLLPAILASVAIGFSVSIMLYLPTLFIGAGRYPTLATELVALVAGADRRLIAVCALILQTLPMLVFLTALSLPKWLFRHRLGMLD